MESSGIARCLVADLGLGNVGSVCNVLERLGYGLRQEENPPGTEDFDVILLPGVGSFDSGMTALEKSGWKRYLQDMRGEVPIVGICLGMQLLGRSSAEGHFEGLGFLPLDFEALEERVKVYKAKTPHMGWSTVSWRLRPQGAASDPLERYYFAHSYASFDTQSESVIGTTLHGVQFVSVARAGNTVGFQFHPEKSHRFGLSLLASTIDQLANGFS